MRIFARRMQFGNGLSYSIGRLVFQQRCAVDRSAATSSAACNCRVSACRSGAAVRIILSIRVLCFVTLVLVIAAGFPIALGLLKSRGRRASRSEPCSLPGRPRSCFSSCSRFSAADREARSVAPVRQAQMILAGDFRALLMPSVRSASHGCCPLAASPSRCRARSARGGARTLEFPLRLCSRSRPQPC